MADAEATPTPTGLPPGISKPLAGISSTDQSGLIAILTGFALGLVLLSIAVRIFVRRGLGVYRVDDYTFFAASIFAIVQASLVFRELQQGLGKLEENINPSHIPTIEKLSFVADLFYITTLFLSKCSTSFLFLYLTPGRAHMRAIWLAIAASVTWLVSSIMLEAIRCHPNRPWTDDMATCTNSFARWAFIASFDTLIEIGIVSLSVYIVWGLQMSFGSKMIVVGAFSCRIPNIAFSLTRLVFLNRPFEPATSHLWDSRVVSATQLAIGYSIIASIIPYLKPFMMAYERPETSRASHYPSGRSGGSSNFKLSALTSKSSGTATTTLATVDIEDDPGFLKENRSPGDNGRRRSTLRLGRLRPEITGYEARASAVDNKEEKDRKSDQASDDSQMMIIKKGVEWSVQFDPRRSRERGESFSRPEGSRGPTPGDEEILPVRQDV
ncbi:uncharacterized protein BDR25DRAFT_262441 [Lindgomyces ingoldianus]|uniref:Uncharacterized protein n=1 Tax=Lindgomyces ingoldianus TaxID=673940 RepID=A0ACB6QUE3_9PLEO|nr:uncharacterized protein BDR25DRAFT_262441 [Lindgomyces ingoldianus]KAF2470505.1 hypothetical protein BDR25DRAFT_262441 [Lindgomyces ingoldianus]